MYYFSNLFR